ncbi:MAG: hypothetical protein EU539_02185 [Promethearchaeota archaeon]|nr:MAG: hypothetical protein EU539_02185 [Candidatus Lokiarchaeota archaeon]
MFVIASKSYGVRNRYGGSSTFVCGLFFILFGFFNFLIGYVPYPYNGFMVWWIAIVMGVNVAFVLIIRHVGRQLYSKKEELEPRENMVQRKWSLKSYVVKMTEKDIYKDCVSIKMEVVRKSFHLAGFLFLFAYFGFFFIPPFAQIVNNMVLGFINDIGWYYTSLWGDTKHYPYKKDDFQAVIDLTIFAFIGALVFSIIPDLIRVILGAKYSILNFLTKQVLRPKEYNAVGPHIYLISGIIISYMLYIVGIVHILVVITGILIACFSDALAALVGRLFGTHQVRCVGGDIKTIEGFAAGVSSSFLIALILLGPIYAIFAALIFFFLDFFPTVIADNISNPIFIIIGIHLIILLLRLPIGWG